jgi:tetratricopeptide (TPR) repeat protein
MTGLMAQTGKHWSGLLLAVCLGVATLTVCWPVVHNDFTKYDDGGYVADNPVVLRGLTWEGVGWAFSTRTQANWHPLTWLSHMLDVQCFGVDPAGHHFTSLLFHTANTLLLFLLLLRTTGAALRSAFVAAFFALHPLHVESVAWVAERKDVLSTFFFFLTLLAYRKYAEVRGNGACCVLRVPSSSSTEHGTRNTEHGTRSTLYYWLALLCFALGLMSKPMLVTVPLVLLLLDVWPLKRLHSKPEPSELKSLLIEKLPFLALAGLAGAVTLGVQSPAMSAGVPLGERLENAVLSYVKYLGKLFWPVDLAAYYPYPKLGHGLGEALLWGSILGALALVLVSLLALRQLPRQPWFAVGWFWFLGTLLPVIGIIQVGSQAMADRYTYIPSIGFFILCVWGAALTAEWLGPRLAPKFPQLPGLSAAALGSVLLAACSVATRIQISYWRNDATLFTHALAVTQDNAVALHHTGRVLAEHGQLDLALARYRAALAIDSTPGPLYLDLGVALEQKGQTNEAITMLRRGCEAQPWAGQYLSHLGGLLWKVGRSEEALEKYEAAVKARPDLVDPQYNLGLCLARFGRWSEAIPHFAAAVRLKPDDTEARASLGEALLRQGRGVEAETQFREWVRLDPTNAGAHQALARSLVHQDRLSEALDQFRRAVELRPDWPEALNGLAWLLATLPQAELRNGPEAVRLAERACALTGTNDIRFLSTLDAAYAQAGRFSEAVRTAHRVKDLAEAASQQEIAQAAQERLARYEKQQTASP